MYIKIIILEFKNFDKRFVEKYVNNKIIINDTHTFVNYVILNTIRRRVEI